MYPIQISCYFHFTIFCLEGKRKVINLIIFMLTHLNVKKCFLMYAIKNLWCDILWICRKVFCKMNRLRPYASDFSLYILNYVIV